MNFYILLHCVQGRHITSIFKIKIRNLTTQQSSDSCPTTLNLFSLETKKKIVDLIKILPVMQGYVSVNMFFFSEYMYLH